jgi:transcription antitermination factor NusG
MLSMATNSSAVAVLPTRYSEPYWYAAYTCPRHEKRIAEQLQRKEVDFYLPLYETQHRWKDRKVIVSLPLFPGYVFVHIALRDRLKVLEIPSVVRLVGFDGAPTPLPEEEIQLLRSGLSQRLRAQPHPYLKAGRKVRVKSGPLQGAEGILLRHKDKLRVVLSVDLIMRSVAVEIDAADLEPIS